MLNVDKKDAEEIENKINIDNINIDVLKTIAEENREKKVLIIDEENKISYNSIDKDEENIPIMDKLLNEGNYSTPQIIIVIMASLVWFIDGLVMTLLNSLFIPIKAYFNIEDMQLSIIASSLFLGVAIGSIISGFAAKYYTRRFLIILCTSIIFIGQVLLPLATEIKLFTTLRFITGIAQGLLLPIVNNQMCECLPIQYRSSLLIMVNLFFGVSAGGLNLLMLFVMPDLQTERLNQIYIYSSIPIFLSNIFFYFYIKESPRYLILNNENEQAYKILEDIVKRNLTDEEKAKLILDANSGINHKLSGGIVSLFNGSFKLVTLVLIILWMSNSFIAYGGMFTLSLMLKKVLVQSNRDIILSQFKIFLYITPGCLLGAALTEIKFFGRKTSILIAFIFISLFNLIGVFDTERIEIYFGMGGLFIGVSFNVVGCYSCEVFPTKIRDIALGLLYFSTRVAGFLSQFVSMALFEINHMSPFIASLVLAVISAFATYLLPYDTYGKPLDTQDQSMIVVDTLCEEEKNNKSL